MQIQVTLADPENLTREALVCWRPSPLRDMTEELAGSSSALVALRSNRFLITHHEHLNLGVTPEHVVSTARPAPDVAVLYVRVTAVNTAAAASFRLPLSATAGVTATSELPTRAVSITILRQPDPCLLPERECSKG
jgi:hypothetical protein